MKLQIQSVIYGNQVDALVKAMKALQQAVKVYHRRVGDLQVRLISVSYTHLTLPTNSLV